MNSAKRKQAATRQGLGWLTAVIILAGHAGMASAQTTKTTVQILKPTVSTKVSTPFRPKFLGTEVAAAGKSLSTQPGFVFQGTMYIPIWYVMQDLKKMNIPSTWDGLHWHITLPKGWTVQDPKVSPKSGSGNIQIFLNGHEVIAAPGKFAIPPGNQQVSAFMPIWYVMQALNAAKFHSTWNGKQWTLTVPNPRTSGSGSTGTSNPGGTGTPSSSGGSSASGGTTPTPTPSPPVSTAPQAGPGQVSKETFAVELLQALNIPPQQNGSFADVPTGSADLGYVTAAANSGILPADGPNLYGAGDQVTLAQADSAIWTALGIGHASDEPGGSPSAWGNVVGLNPTGLAVNQPLTQTSTQILLQNLHTLEQSYRLDASGDLHVVYPVADEFNNTFSQMPTDVLNTLYATPTDIQSAITQTYQFFDSITAHLQGSDMVVSLPNPMGSSWFAYAVSSGTLQYSLDGGTTWTAATVLDTRILSEQGLPDTSTLLLKTTVGSELSISYNQLAPATQGVGSSVALGEVQIENSNNTWTVQRVDING